MLMKRGEVPGRGLFDHLKRLLAGEFLEQADCTDLQEATERVWPGAEPGVRDRVRLLRRVWPDLAPLNSEECFLESLWHLWLPLAVMIGGRAHPDRLYCQGVLGPQGSGKSTLAAAVRAILDRMGVRAIALSIDDLYLPFAGRAPLAAEGLIHRGPPGTHDVGLGLATLAALEKPGPVWLPRFDKSAHGGQGERWAWAAPRPGLVLEGQVRGGEIRWQEGRWQGGTLALPERFGQAVALAALLPGVQTAEGASVILETTADGQAALTVEGTVHPLVPTNLPVGWELVAGPVAAVIFEGWCVGVRPIACDRWPDPLAEASNRRLAAYLPLWDRLDHLLVLDPVEAEASRRWRLEAERTRMAAGRAGMDAVAIDAFVTYFRRALPPELFVSPRIATDDGATLVVRLGPEHEPLRVGAPPLV